MKREKDAIAKPSPRLDVLSIGDITTDVFIKLREAAVECNGTEEDSCFLRLPFKQKIPYEMSETVRATGNAANTAIAMSRLGLRSAVMTDLGDDVRGRECLAVLLGEGVSTKYVRTHKGKPSNQHFILWFEKDRTILTNHADYEASFPEITDSPKWIYLTSLGTESLDYYAKIFKFLETDANIKLAFQPGTKQIKMGINVLLPAFLRADIFFCNKEEAERITGSKDDEDISILLDKIKDLGPKTVVITDGTKGAYAFDGKEKMVIPAYPGEAVERTGAGDAFSAAIVAALAFGLPLKEALLWGPPNAMSVTQHVGAQKGLLRKTPLEGLLQKAPKDYKIRSL